MQRLFIRMDGQDLAVFTLHAFLDATPTVANYEFHSRKSSPKLGFYFLTVQYVRYGTGTGTGTLYDTVLVCNTVVSVSGVEEWE